MARSLEYNYRMRTSIDEMCFGKGSTGDGATFDRFSLPPKPKTTAQEFSIIERPDIPELDGFIERYL